MTNTGYTVFIREQVTPPFTIVNSAYGQMQIPTQVPAPQYPPAAECLYRPESFDIYSPDPLRRAELLTDPNGTATEIEAIPGLRDWKALLLRNEGQRRLEGLVGHYMAAERETWPYQREEAMRWAHGGMQDTPYCDAIAAGRGVPREAFLAAVYENTQLFAAASAAILGQQQALLDRVYSVATIADTLSVHW